MSSQKLPSKNILIVDDHPIVRQGIKSLLASEPDLVVCGEAESSGDAFKQMRKLKPDVAIIDISLKGTDGLELTKALREMEESMPILIMSMHDEVLYAERALRAGANGYIMKDQVADNIVEAVRRVLKGDIYVSEGVRQRILRGVRGIKDKNKPSVDRLSDRELEVFRLLGEGLGTRQIAEQLKLSIKTIETYRAHIKEKLNLSSGTELVRYAVQWVEHQFDTENDQA